jgi:hypothetical protein
MDFIKWYLGGLVKLIRQVFTFRWLLSPILHVAFLASAGLAGLLAGVVGGTIYNSWYFFLLVVPCVCFPAVHYLVGEN